MSAQTDRELLELAAKAAGRNIRWDGNVAVLLDYEPGVDDCSAWHPLTDDGDAFRLAVKLRLLVLPAGSGVVVTVDSYGIADEATESAASDPYAATRRAIVRAAASIAAATGQKGEA